MVEGFLEVQDQLFLGVRETVCVFGTGDLHIRGFLFQK